MDDIKETGSTAEPESAPASTDTSTESQGEQKAAPEGETSPKDTAEQKLLAGKYKDPKELEKGYKELERKHGETVAEHQKRSEEAQQRYEQLAQQWQYQQYQAQQKQLDEMPPEEKTTLEVNQLKQQIHQQSIQYIVDKFLDKNPDLKGDDEQEQLEINAQKIRNANPYMPPERILEQAAVKARERIAKWKEAGKKEVVETRTELKSAESPKGSPKESTPSEPVNESPQDYVAWRRQQVDMGRRLH